MTENGESIQLPARPRPLRVARLCAVALLGFVLALSTFIGLFLWSLHNSENSAFLREQLLSALNTGLGPGHVVELERAQLQLAGLKPVFSIGGLAVTQPGGGGRATLEKAEFDLPLHSLWRLQPQATAVRFEGLRVVLAPPTGNPADAMAEAKTALHATIGVTHSLFALAGKESVLKAIEGQRIGIFRRDGAGGEIPVNEGLDVLLERVDDRISLRVGQKGASEKVVLTATGIGGPADDQSPIHLKSEAISAPALAALLGQVLPGFSPDLKIAAEGLIAGNATRLKLTAGPGVVDRPDWGIPALKIDNVEVDLAVPVPGQGILINRLSLRAGEARLEAKGALRAIENGILAITLSASDAVFGRLTAAEEIVALSRLELAGEVSRDGRTLTIQALDFSDGTAIGRFEGVFSSAEGGKIGTILEAKGFDARRALRLWPAGIAPELRDWLIRHVDAGRLRNLFLRSLLEGPALQDAFNFRPVPDDSMLVEYRLDEVTFRPIIDAPPVRKAIAAGSNTGRRASITIESGEIEAQPGRVIAVRNAEMAIADLTQSPATMQLKLPFSGRVDSVIALLATPTLKRVANPPTDLAIQEGTAEGVAQGWVRLVDKPGPQDARIDATAEIRGLRIDPVTKGERLDGGSFQLLARNGTTTISGEGRLNGVPSQITFRAEPGKDVEGTVKMVLDDQGRARRGLDLRPVLTGPTPITASISLPQRGPPDIDVEIDLTRAKVEGAVPGFVKRPGQPAKATFDFATRDGRQILDDFELDLGQVSAKGRIELGADGQFARAELASLRLSPGDNVRASIERQRTGVRISIRGNAFDMRPFLRGFQSGRIDDQKNADLDLDLQTTVLLGFNSEIVAGADVQATRRGGNLTRLQVRGRFGSEPVTVETAGQSAEGTRLVINSSDAGALVRFLDLYPRAYGGRLLAEIAVGAAGQRGRVQAWDFTIRGEQFLRQYAGGAQAGSGPMSQGQNAARSESVAFQKLRAEFVRKPGRIDFTEAVMWGPQVGGNIEGYLDYGADRVDLKGVLVPAYALNNLFAQLPLVGPIFGGSQYEGLFALPFVVTGRASTPVLRTNALSVIAPGFLRKMFELRREDGPQGRNTNAPPARSNPAQ